MFIPSKDREGRAIAQDVWVERSLELLGRLFRGATAFPPGRGVWRDDESGGKLLHEISVMVVSYSNPEDHTDAGVRELRKFLHQFGVEANQGEVGVVVGGKYFGISRYDRPQKGRRRP